MDFFCVHVNPAVTFGLILGSEKKILSYDTNAGLPPTNSTKLGIEETRNMNERRGRASPPRLPSACCHRCPTSPVSCAHRSSVVSPRRPLHHRTGRQGSCHEASIVGTMIKRSYPRFVDVDGIAFLERVSAKPMI
jgi:hypothetical protein